MKTKIKSCLVASSFLLLSMCAVTSADACVDADSLQQMPLYFHGNYLGQYDINFMSTLFAVEGGSTDIGKPYYKKVLNSGCPVSLSDSNCIEYTVYPQASNFRANRGSQPIMYRIMKYNQGQTDPGVVRIYSDLGLTQYVYTITHNRIFCGPYPLVEVIAHH